MTKKEVNLHTKMVEAAEKPERVIRIVRRSRRGLLPVYLFVILFFYLAYYSRFVKGGSETLELFASLFFLAGLFVLVYGEIRINYKKLLISNKRAVLQEGIFRRHSTTIRYSSITEVVAKQSLLQRLLGCGDLSIRTSGAKKEYELSIERVPSPFKVKGLLEHFIFAEHKG